MKIFPEAAMQDRPSYVCLENTVWTSRRRSTWTPHNKLRVIVGQVTQRQAGHPRLLSVFWLQCRGCLCTEEMGTGNARIWSPRDPISWVCEWRQNRTLNLNFKKVGGEKWATKQGWSPSRACARGGRVCCCWCPGFKTAVSRGGDLASVTPNVSDWPRLSWNTGILTLTSTNWGKICQAGC